MTIGRAGEREREKTKGNKEKVNDKRERVIESRESNGKGKKNIDNWRREEIERSTTHRREE